MSAGAPCPGCGAWFAPVEGEGHVYMIGSAACWRAYGEVLAREYQDPALFAACHRLTVDAYALQHPGRADDRRTVQSVWLHFAALDAVFRKGRSFAHATNLLRDLAGRALPALPAAPVWTVTVADVLAAGPACHAEAVERWARSAYEAWAPQLIERIEAPPRR